MKFQKIIIHQIAESYENQWNEWKPAIKTNLRIFWIDRRSSKIFASLGSARQVLSIFSMIGFLQSSAHLEILKFNWFILEKMMDGQKITCVKTSIHPFLIVFCSSIIFYVLKQNVLQTQQAIAHCRARSILGVIVCQTLWKFLVVYLYSVLSYKYF